MRRKKKQLKSGMHKLEQDAMIDGIPVKRGSTLLFYYSDPPEGGNGIDVVGGQSADNKLGPVHSHK